MLLAPLRGTAMFPEPPRAAGSEVRQSPVRNGGPRRRPGMASQAWEEGTGSIDNQLTPSITEA